jgi:hypothetical protein
MKTSFTQLFSVAILIIGGTSCTTQKQPEVKTSAASDSVSGSFQSDVEFLKRFTKVIVLQDSSGKGKVALSPALQGRVMTSTSEGDGGFSYGWINRQAFLSGDTSDHINVFGGEDRFWLGPEGGQYSIYFEKGKPFNLDNWHVPPLIDLEPFNVSETSGSEAAFTKEATLTNYSGTVFNLAIERKIKVLQSKEAWNTIGLPVDTTLSLIAYQSENTLENAGTSEWKKESGLLSIWILGMFNPTEATTIVIPFNKKNAALSDVVNDTYFGKVPEDRLIIDDHAVYFKGDGKFRSKIGLKAEHATGWMGSFDAENEVLTLVKFSKPETVIGYVNSLWEIQKEPYKGDAINAYNDGPPSPGAKPLGPFYELESSSPAAALKPRESITHIHTTFHIKGTGSQMDKIMIKLLGASREEISSAFRTNESAH